MGVALAHWRRDLHRWRSCTQVATHNPAARAFLSACAHNGIRVLADYNGNGGDNIGAGWMQVSRHEKRFVCAVCVARWVQSLVK